MMGFSAAIFAGRPEFGNFTDALGMAVGLEKYAGRLPAILFALALLDACIIGAAAVSLATAYAIGDVLSLRHSLHRKPHDAKGFFGVYFGLIVLAATLVLTPGTPLGLLTNAVQTLAGVLLPSATVFLLLLSNDKAVLGPWVNSRLLNLFTGAVIAALVMLSIILTASVLFPEMNETVIIGILACGGLLVINRRAPRQDGKTVVRFNDPCLGMCRPPKDSSAQTVSNRGRQAPRCTVLYFGRVQQLANRHDRAMRLYFALMREPWRPSRIFMHPWAILMQRHKLEFLHAVLHRLSGRSVG